MLLFLLSQGFFLILYVMVTFRWVDLRTLRLLCLYAVAGEFLLWTIFSSLVLNNGCSYIQVLYKSVSSLNLPIMLDIILIFDGLSSFFIKILFMALILCFSFLISYFEYDINSQLIIVWSVLFSQLAVMFFCTYDLFSLILLWEWISIVSFFLIRFWSSRVTTLKAGLKVFVISQIGDLFFIVGIVIILSSTCSTDFFCICLNSVEWFFFEVFIWGVSIKKNTLIGLLLLSATFLKSAQIFFYPWLLDAMEAPVPISAQLHSSTLVIIGFYVLLRFWHIFEIDFFLRTVVCFVGFITALGAGILGFFQEDCKRLLACSTASQLGYSLVSFGLGLYSEGSFLLAFCCVNKAYTFVWLGVFMERHGGLSDFRLLSSSSSCVYERVGLLSSVLNSVIFPGAFMWHIKTLTSFGLSGGLSFSFSICAPLLALTWVFSSLYLIKLLIVIFTSPRKTKPQFNSFVDTSLVRGVFGQNALLFVVQVLCLTVLYGYGLVTCCQFIFDSSSFRYVF